ncbi:hypothetical protein AJ80_08774 [Polytolypa hystricis UAMH7299]|uniref:Major facilitator superfamily (MFS) profile domain-containing protein n=1 Tax=Polytolypa hystricis (strain UAMH7299) TaxID=1447883 RepID=A0A2B7X2F9_POLH7|nr:hypothetical protein AJ80_08774 [Polytolypa hystricis UAMH7299]
MVGIDEKAPVRGGSLSSQEDIERSSSWEYAQELDARRKVDSSVLPLLFLGLLVFQLDRMNLASALTGGFSKDVGIDQSTVNLGNQLMFLGIVVLEIPANIILQRLGPRKWMSAQVILFGFITTMQIFVKNHGGILATRAIFGLSEAGYIPGGIFTLSCWYMRRELAKRAGIFFFGMFGGNAISPLLGAGILKLDGKQGLKGWQWIFLLEGVFTMLVGLSLLFLLPDILQKRLEFEDDEDCGSAQGMRIKGKLVLKTVLHYRRWPHFVSTGLVFATWSPLTTYTPTVIVSLGFDRIEANALAAVGAFIALPVVFLFAWISGKTNKRGITVMLAQTCYLIILIVARSVHPHVGKWSRWALWTAVSSFAVGYHPVHNTWVQDVGDVSHQRALWQAPKFSKAVMLHFTTPASAQ